MLICNYFLWNFKLETDQIDLSQVDTEITASTNHTYEQRFFWDEHTQVINCRFFQAHLLSDYTIEKNKDYYLLLPNQENIKIRKKRLHYKPQVLTHGQTLAFISKEKYHVKKHKHQIREMLSLSKLKKLKKVKDYKKEILNRVPHIKVLKYRVTFHWTHISDLQVEFSKLLIDHHTYYSCVIEASSLTLVESVVQQMNINQTPTSYVNFLRSITSN